MSPVFRVLFAAVLASGAILIAQNEKFQQPAGDQPKVVKDRVFGQIRRTGSVDSEHRRVRGNARVLDGNTLVFEDGTRARLGSSDASDLDQTCQDGDAVYPCGKEAAEALAKLIGDRTVTCIDFPSKEWSCYAGETSLEEAMVPNGWGIARHSVFSLTEVIAREARRGVWRGTFVLPERWRKGERLPGFDAKSAFAALKALAGQWEGTSLRVAVDQQAEKQERPARVEWRAAANGSVVIETLHPETANEMITVFHMDGPDQLLLTRYCALGNQPRMKFVSGAQAGEIRFSFAGGMNLDPAKDPHVRETAIRFLQDGRIQSEFEYWVNGKIAGKNTLTLARRK